VVADLVAVDLVLPAFDLARHALVRGRCPTRIPRPTASTLPSSRSFRRALPPSRSRPRM
jgi:hypothetical protein